MKDLFGRNVLHTLVLTHIGLASGWDEKQKMLNEISDAKLHVAAEALYQRNILQTERMIETVLRELPQLVTEEDILGMTPQAEASAHRGLGRESQKQFVKVVHALVGAGGNPNTVDMSGDALVHHAVRIGSPTLLEYLLKKGADPDTRDRRGRAALEYALHDGALRSLDILLDHNADPDLTDARGWTLLDRMAVEKSDRDSPTVQRLIVAGGQYAKQLPLQPRADPQEKTPASANRISTTRIRSRKPPRIG